MSAPHTPGPWEVDAVRLHCVDGYWEVPIRSTDFGVTIARAHGYVQSVNSTDAVTANARLIAAAPDLLEVCKLAVFEFENEGQVFRDAVAAMRAAIAKAEGRAE